MNFLSRADLATFATKTDLALLEAKLKADISDPKAELLKWVFGTVGFQTVLIIGTIVTMIHWVK